MDIDQALPLALWHYGTLSYTEGPVIWLWLTRKTFMTVVHKTLYDEYGAQDGLLCDYGIHELLTLVHKIYSLYNYKKKEKTHLRKRYLHVTITHIIILMWLLHQSEDSCESGTQDTPLCDYYTQYFNIHKRPHVTLVHKTYPSETMVRKRYTPHGTRARKIN